MVITKFLEIIDFKKMLKDAVIFYQNHLFPFNFV